MISVYVYVYSGYSMDSLPSLICALNDHGFEMDFTLHIPKM